MENVHYLNLEYFLLRTYQFFTGGHIDSASAYEGIRSFWVQLSILGLALSFILLVMTVWVRIRLIVVEHEALEKHEAEAHRKRTEREEKKGNQRWERIVALMGYSDEAQWRIAIIEADSMLEELLTERGYPGETLGDKLKNANPLQFTTLDLAWQAHKVRNALAHLGEAYPLSEREARATIDLYARVFGEFGII
jgi:hypothetical protein